MAPSNAAKVTYRYLKQTRQLRSNLKLHNSVKEAWNWLL